MQLDELEDLHERAQDNNAEDGITGALVYVDGFFLQILEGPQERVEGLMRRIDRDLRHGDVTILQAGEVESAAFTGWTMAYVSATPKQVADWAGLSSTKKLPEVWEDMRQDRSRVTQLSAGILAALNAEPELPGGAD
jgi:hypothetical protein